MDEKVTMSTQLWSDEVAKANAGSKLPDKDIAYEWSNGRQFEETAALYVTE